jgi:hypothetical protein
MGQNGQFQPNIGVSWAGFLFYKMGVAIYPPIELARK